MKSKSVLAMTIVLTLLLIIILELSGLYLAQHLGLSIRNLFRKSQKKDRSPRLRWLDVMIGYATIFGVFGFIVYTVTHLF